MAAWPRSAAAIAVAVLLAACSSNARPAPAGQDPTGLTPVSVQTPDGQKHQALVPAGWTMSLWAPLPNARLAAWAPDKTLLVSVPASGQIIRFTPDKQQHVLLDNLQAPHGMAFAGSTLYVAESNQIDAYTYANGAATDRRVLVPDLPNERSPDLGGKYAHALKSVTIGPGGTVYFSIGSTANISPQDRDATPQRATIMRVAPNGGAPQVLARGVRNGTGLATAPDGSIWTAVNGRDNTEYPYPGPSYGKVIQDYVNDHPPEIFARLTDGRDLGWPFCNPDGSGGNVPFIRDVETNADGSKLACNALPPAEQTLGAHSAPLGLSFVDGSLPAPYAAGALVGVHGSWNRVPPRAPEVSFFAWHNGTLGNQQTLVGGFQATDGSRWGRPVAAVAGPDGAVYITDDYAGAVYRLAPPGR